MENTCSGPPRVSVVIVTYCSAAELPACVGSALSQALPLEIFIVDNASPDETPEVAAALDARFDNVTAILNARNLGLAAGNNQVLGRCRGDYVLVLNPDASLREGALRLMVDSLDRQPGVGVLGPMNVYPDGRPHRSFHDGWGLSHVLAWRTAPYGLVRHFWDRFSSYERREPLFVSGACLLIRREIFEALGGYDPEFFLTVEDACDLCVRARAIGFRVFYLPDAQVVHVGGRSGARAPFIVVWQGYRGTLYYFMKHKSRVEAALAWFLLTFSACLRCGVAALLGTVRKRYRTTARNYGAVAWSLARWNPLATWPRAGVRRP